MTSLTSSSARAGARPGTWPERVARALFFRVLRSLEHGRLEIVEQGQHQVFGPDAAGSELHVEVRVHDPGFYPAALLEGTVGVGRSYMQRHWGCDDLARLIRVFARNARALDQWRNGPARVVAPLHRAWLWTRRNSVEGARRNIHAHYDLGNTFFATFLDPTMMYSSAIYPTEQSSLEEAALAKIHRICRKLDLRPGERVLEIGTGWGGFATTAAREYGCHVTTITISAEQAAHARELVEREGLGDRVDVRLCDYREIDGTFDKLVSIEMIEAVGAEHLETYLKVCSDRLRSDGRMLLQAIVIDDRVYERAVRSVDFIKKYIFPGSFIPSPLAIGRAVRQVTDLRPLHVEDLTEHYARTLRDWHERFVAASERIRALGFDEEFQRCWRFYFAYCEGGFIERRIGVQQLMYAKPFDRRPAPLGNL
jgi:cyclopropane-fatty-acyl-phospholipid synthase